MFSLAIEIGNSAMESPDDVARALRRLADELETSSAAGNGRIRDDNGNAVGRWTFSAS